VSDIHVPERGKWYIFKQGGKTGSEHHTSMGPSCPFRVLKFIEIFSSASKGRRGQQLSQTGMFSKIMYGY
jgi:hypothetical protein